MVFISSTSVCAQMACNVNAVDSIGTKTMEERVLLITLSAQ